MHINAYQCTSMNINEYQGVCKMRRGMLDDAEKHMQDTQTHIKHTSNTLPTLPVRLALVSLLRCISVES